MMAANPIALQAIDHVVIRTAHIAPMLAFYREVLGCALEREVASLGLYQLRAGAALIDLVDASGEIGRMGGAPPGETGHNMDHFCVQAEPWDADAILAFLGERGVEASGVEQRYGAKGTGPSIYLKDPDGNTVELKGPPGA